MINKKYKQKIKFGHKVRIIRTKSLFEKGYLPNWSEEIHTIHEVKNTRPVTYTIKDHKGEVLMGSFYNEELQHTCQTDQDLSRIEKVVRKKKIDGVEHALVKWVGYSEKDNSWIPVSDLKNV